MSQRILTLKVDLSHPLVVHPIPGILGGGDCYADIIRVLVYQDGEPVQVTGTVTGYVMNQAGDTFTVSGAADGNGAQIQLPETAYELTGPITVAIRETRGTVRTTLAICSTAVKATTTGTEYDPGDMVPNIDNLREAWERAEAAADDANEAAAAVPAMIATTFSTSTAYVAGQTVYYNGALYRFTANHAAGAWTGADAVQIVLGDEVGGVKSDVNDLKSALDDIGAVSVGAFPLTIGHMMDTGKWGQLAAGSYQHFVFPVSSGDVVKFECTVKNTVVGFVTDYVLPLTSSTDVLYSSVTGFTSKIAITKDTPYEWTTPSDARYLIVEKVYGSADVGISVFSVNGYNYTVRLNAQVVEIQNSLEEKAKLIQGTSNALSYIHGASGVSWENGTLDSSGVFGPSDRSIVSSFIDLHGRNLYMCLPEDGTITARTYYYSDASESSFGVRGAAKTASSVSTNGTYRYCRILMYYTSSATPRDSNLSKKAFFLFGYADNYRGKIGQLGVSAFSGCTDEGYYSFVASDLANLSDAPSELTTGGILFTYSHFGSFTLYQAIYDTSGNKYVRYGTGRFVKTGDSQVDLAITPAFEIGAITSSTGLNASSTKRVRMTSTVQIKGGFKLEIPAGMKAEIITYVSATIAEGNRGETSLGFLTEGSYLFYPRYGETHFRIYGGYTDDRTITDATVGLQFKMTYFANENSPIWLALGDSITQGFYSYNNGTSDTFGRTLNNWAAIAANKANLRLVNSGVGGSGYVEAGTVLDMKNAKDHVTGVDFSGFDCVTLAWGVNDWKGNQNVGSVDSMSGDGTICGNMKYVIETILASNPTIKIFVITPLNCAGYSKNYGSKATNWGLGYSFTNSGTLENVYQAEKAVAEYYGLQLIDQTHQSVVNRESLLTMLVDGVHPSMNCHTALGAEMAGKITFR